MLIISICLIIVSILLIIYSFYSLKHTHQINKTNDEYNQKIQKEYYKLNQNLDLIKKEFFIENQKYRDIKEQVNIANKELIDTQNHLNDIQNNILKTTETQKELSQKAFENYCDILEKQYKEQEEEYEMYKDALETAYSNKQLELMRNLDEVQQELAQIEATRAAVIQAQTREKEIEQKLSFYCLKIKDTELKDIAILESIKPKLNQPRILSMLIWQTYWRKPMTDLCNNIIGTTVKTGIYKITNQKTKECYIGQAVDLSSRFKEHAKAGLGIDAPPANKLYKAIQEFGIQNFSWEVLEFCPKEQLNEKEQYYIKLYQSKDYGYNTLKGVNTK